MTHAYNKDMINGENFQLIEKHKANLTKAYENEKRFSPAEAYCNIMQWLLNSEKNNGLTEEKEVVLLKRSGV
jgi:hypothetical protein